uniref:L-dopachrome tautomerase n=1 Tax=Cyprinus carpio TaxID=7962 RepID=A0A8C1QZZ4_CYPCA
KTKCVYLHIHTISMLNALEGYDKPDGELDSSVSNLHNLVHLFLNGTSALSHSAANDPIFLVLHAFTDAIFEEWMRRSRENASLPDEMAPIGHNRHYNMVPFFPPVTNEEIYITSEQLGYSYAVELEGNKHAVNAYIIGIIYPTKNANSISAYLPITMHMLKSFEEHATAVKLQKKTKNIMKAP